MGKLECVCETSTCFRQFYTLVVFIWVRVCAGQGLGERCQEPQLHHCHGGPAAVARGQLSGADISRAAGTYGGHKLSQHRWGFLSSFCILLLSVFRDGSIHVGVSVGKTGGHGGAVVGAVTSQQGFETRFDQDPSVWSLYVLPAPTWVSSGSRDMQVKWRI